MTLLELQREFRSWLLTESGGIESQIRTRPEVGLAAYLNNYRAQLMTCLVESFPVLQAWLGEDAFKASVATHIDRFVPHSWTLDDYALDFPETLAQLYPRDPEVVDLARLERELALAFTGTDAAPLDLASLAHVDWDVAVICFVPTFKLMPVQTNAAALWSSIRAGEASMPLLVVTAPTMLAIWRNQLSPAFRSVSTAEAEVLAQLQSGMNFGSVCARLVERVGDEQGPVIAGGYLRQWLDDGMVARIDG